MSDSKDYYKTALDNELANAKLQISIMQSNQMAAIECEKIDASKALVALSDAGYPTPEETYGSNTSWAISDLCRALAAAKQRIAELEAALGMVYEKWENGVSCYEDHEDRDGYIGLAFKLNKEEEDTVLALLGHLYPDTL